MTISNVFCVDGYISPKNARILGVGEPLSLITAKIIVKGFAVNVRIYNATIRREGDKFKVTGDPFMRYYKVTS